VFGVKYQTKNNFRRIRYLNRRKTPLSKKQRELALRRDSKTNATARLCILNTKRIIILYINVADCRYSRGSCIRGA
jgi:hypothetical protein